MDVVVDDDWVAQKKSLFATIMWGYVKNRVFCGRVEKVSQLDYRRFDPSIDLFFNFFAIFLPTAFRPPLKGVHEGGRFVLLIPFINYATLTASLNTLQPPCVSWATPMTP